MITTKDTTQRREVGSSRNLPKSLSSNSEPHLTDKTGHQLTQLLLTVSKIVQLFTHVLGVERNLTCWSVKMVKLYSVARARAIVHLEAGLKQQHVAVFFGVSQSTISKLRLRYSDAHDVKGSRPRSGRPRITTDRVDGSIRLTTLRNRRITAHSLHMRNLGRHGR